MVVPPSFCYATNNQVELLIGKAYSDWGHISDAVSVYDRLISSHPNDFRGYLAKVFLFLAVLFLKKIVKGFPFHLCTLLCICIHIQLNSKKP